MKKILILLMIIGTFFSHARAEDNATTWIKGKLVVIYNNAYSIQKPQENVQYSLQITKIKSISLDMSKLIKEKWQKLVGKDVKIKVNKAHTPSNRSYSVLEIRYSPTIKNTNLDNALTQEESQKPWMNILCKFLDITTEPQTSDYYQAIFANTSPYLEHYWKDISYGKIDISGTQTRDTWVTLAHDRSYYVNGSDVNLNALATDCLASSGLTTNELDNFYGVNFFFNGSLGGSSWGGGGYTYIADSHSKYLGLIAHEMGHGYGLAHSSGRYGQSYDSPWDIMSGGGDGQSYGVYYDAPSDTIAFYKQKLGLININNQWSNRTFNASSGYTLHLTSLDNTVREGNYHIVNISSTDGTKHYSVEARDKRGYDSSLPAKAVIIHEIEDNYRAYIVDSDNNGDLSDAGTQWQVGETFSDNSNGISVEIVSATATGYTIRVTAPKAKPIAVTSITATDTLLDKIRITWSPSAGAEYYKVLRYSSWNIDSIHQIFTTANNDTSYDDIVRSFSQYFYRIQACNTGGCSLLSEYEYDSGKRHFSINASDGIYDDKVTITYPALPNFVNKFQLYRAIEGETTYGYISNATILVDTTAQKNIRYNYWMVLFDADNHQIGDGFDIGYISSVPIIDTDNDGIADSIDTDDDGDGISDSVEIANGLNPLNASDAQADFDSDGFSNALEIKIGTDMRNANSKPKWTPIIMDSIIIMIPSKG